MQQTGKSSFSNAPSNLISKSDVTSGSGATNDFALNTKEIRDEITSLKEELEAQKERVERQGRIINKQQIRYTETLGIFVALFTFVSINIQIFSRITSLNNAMIFVILLFFCLIGFALFLKQILNDQLNPRNFLILVGLLVIIMICFSLPNFTSKIKPIELENSENFESLKSEIDQTKNIMDGFMLRNK